MFFLSYDITSLTQSQYGLDSHAVIPFKDKSLTPTSAQL